MKTKISFFALIIAALALTGCVHTRTVRPGDQADPPFVGINQLGARKTATVLLIDGRTVKARSLQVTRDSVSWFDARTGQFEHIATDEVAQIRFGNWGVGALKGLGIGLFSGVTLGVVTGLLAGDTPPRECGWFGPCTAEEKAAVMGVGLGAMGALVGPFVGASKWRTQVYRFEVSAPPPVVVEEARQQIPRKQ